MTPPDRGIWPHIVVIMVLAGGFYALVPYPYALDDLVKGALIGFMGSALTWEFGTAVQAATSRQASNAAQQAAETALAPPPQQAPQPGTSFEVP